MSNLSKPLERILRVLLKMTGPFPAAPSALGWGWCMAGAQDSLFPTQLGPQKHLGPRGHLQPRSRVGGACKRLQRLLGAGKGLWVRFAGVVISAAGRELGRLQQRVRVSGVLAPLLTPSWSEPTPRAQAHAGFLFSLEVHGVCSPSPMVRPRLRAQLVTES